MPLKTVPDLTTKKEEHEFWATHSSADYETEAVSETIEFDPKARTQEIRLRIPYWLIEDLKTLAADESIPYQRLIKNYLKAFVAARTKTDCEGEN